MSFWKILKNGGAIIDVLDGFADLIKEADVDKDGAIELEDVQRWLDSPQFALAFLGAINGVLKLWRVFSD